MYRIRLVLILVIVFVAFSVTQIPGTQMPIALGAPILAKKKPIQFAAMGDTPYHDIVDTPILLDTFNRLRQNGMSFVLHIGDIWSRCTPCTEHNFQYRKVLFNHCPIPFVIVPGDNELTDCPRENIALNDQFKQWLGNAAFPDGDDEHQCHCIANAAHKPPLPTELLDWHTVLQRFITYALGDPPFTQSIAGSDSSVPPLEVKRMQGRKENVWRTYKSIVFVGINLPNTSPETVLPMPGEDSVRLSPDVLGERKFMDENFSFIQNAFTEAANMNAEAIVVFMQSNLGRTNRKPAIITEFNERLKLVVSNFRRPVLLVHGDQHTPEFESSFQGLSNYWRVEVATSGYAQITFDRTTKVFMAEQH